MTNKPNMTPESARTDAKAAIAPAHDSHTGVEEKAAQTQPEIEPKKEPAKL